jgi:AcrR family transcriptional regulator
MAYEVTKRIKGRDYRYLVEAYRDPETKRSKARWQYVGAVGDDGTVHSAVDRAPRKRVTRDDIIAATAELLEFRTPEHITVSVILARSGASRSTFYRHFPNHQKALSAALARMADSLLKGLPSFEPPRSLEDAKQQLRHWCETYYRTIGAKEALRRAALPSPPGKGGVPIDISMLTEDPAARLSAFLQQVNDAGFASIENPLTVAETIRGIHFALRATAFLAPQHELALPKYDAVYSLIERSIFRES